MEYLNNFDYNNIDNGITYLQNNTLDFYLYGWIIKHIIIRSILFQNKKILL